MLVYAALKRDEETGMEEFLCVERSRLFAGEYIKENICPEFDTKRGEHRVVQNGSSYWYHIEEHCI